MGAVNYFHHGAPQLCQLNVNDLNISSGPRYKMLTNWSNTASSSSCMFLNVERLSIEPLLEAKILNVQHCAA